MRVPDPNLAERLHSCRRNLQHRVPPARVHTRPFTVDIVVTELRVQEAACMPNR